MSGFAPFTYLALLAASASVPIALSCIGPWRADSREWIRLLLAIAATAIPFVLWDIAFADRGLWHFDPRYVLGPGRLGLPWEEIGFFVAIPFACLFIHRAVRAKPGLAIPAGFLRPLWFALLALAAGAAGAALGAGGKAYSLAAFGLAAPLLAWLGLKPPVWSGRFAVTLAMHYLPFFLVNGLLTALPVVTYSAGAILGPRIGSIPIEDAAYSFCLLFLNVALYERMRRAIPSPSARRRDAVPAMSADTE